MKRKELKSSNIQPLQKLKTLRFFSKKKLSILKILSSILIIPLLSCSNVDQDLVVDLASDKFILIDTTATSCFAIKTSADTGNDVGAVHFSAPVITLRWKKNKILTVYKITFTLKGNGVGSFSKVVGSDDLWYSYNSGNPTAVTIAAGSVATPATLTNDCAFKVGGIQVTDAAKDYYGTVTINVYGSYQDGSTTVPVTVNKYAQYIYKGTGI